MRVGAPLLRGAFVDQIDPTLNPVESPTDVVQPLARRARCGNLAPPLRNRWFADSTLERRGFELSVPLRTRQGIIESTYERVKYGFTTRLSYHMLWL